MVRVLDGRPRKTVATRPLTEAEKALAAEHWELVGRVADRMPGGGMDPDERAGWGTMGLIDAVETHDPSRGDFETWAKMRIRAAIRDARKNGAACLIRVKRSSRGESLPFDEYCSMKRPLSLSARNNAKIGEKLVARTHSDVSVDRKAVSLAVATLGPRDATIVGLYYGCGWTMRRIAGRVGVTESGVHRILASCAKRLRGDARIQEAARALLGCDD